MKQAIFKVFAVFVTVVAVAMMGISMASRLVHPDPRAEMNTSAMLNYAFEEVPGETPQWKVTRRFSVDPANPKDRATIATVKSPYEALTKAHKDLATQLGTKTSEMVAQKAAADGERTLFAASQEQDALAVAEKAKQLDQVSEQLTVALRTRSEEIQALTVKSIETRRETEARRTDVLRLRHELAEARTDLFRLTAVRRDLSDRLVRLEIENQSLADRQAQLTGEVKYDSEPVQ